MVDNEKRFNHIGKSYYDDEEDVEGKIRDALDKLAKLNKKTRDTDKIHADNHGLEAIDAIVDELNKEE